MSSSTPIKYFGGKRGHLKCCADKRKCYLEALAEWKYQTRALRNHDVGARPLLSDYIKNAQCIEYSIRALRTLNVVRNGN